MYNIDEYKKIIEERLSSYRYYHSLCVAESAKQLALRFNADEKKAELAGILHDVCKETAPEEQLELIKSADMKITPLELGNKKFYHQISGAAYAKAVLGINDDEIINAIRYHTTGRADMTLMDEIIYLADFISADRDYDDIDKIRSESEKGREYGLLYATRYTIKTVAEQGRILHPDTVALYNSILLKYFSKN